MEIYIPLYPVKVCLFIATTVMPKTQQGLSINVRIENSGQDASFYRPGFNNVIIEYGREYWQVNEI